MMCGYFRIGFMLKKYKNFLEYISLCPPSEYKSRQNNIKIFPVESN